MRYFLSICAGMIIAAGTVHAQVAAPSLAPLLPDSFTANPATIQWSGSSYVGAALLSGELSGTNAGVADPQLEGDLDATLLQGRAVGEMFSFAAEMLNVEISAGNADVGAIELESSSLNVGIAAFIGDSFSVGLGIENTDADTTITAPVAQPTQTEEIEIMVVGAAARLTDTIFLGAALGNETVTPSGTTIEFDRNIIRAGAAMLSISSDFQAHLEAYIENRDAFDKPQGGGGVNKDDKQETTALVAEVIWNNILLGVHLINTNITDVDAAGVTTTDEDETETIVVVGWVPEGGLSIVANVRTEELEDNQGSGDTEEIDTLSIGVAYVF